MVIKGIGIDANLGKKEEQRAFQQKEERVEDPGQGRDPYRGKGKGGQKKQGKFEQNVIQTEEKAKEQGLFGIPFDPEEEFLRELHALQKRHAPCAME